MPPALFIFLEIALAFLCFACGRVCVCVCVCVCFRIFRIFFFGCIGSQLWHVGSFLSWCVGSSLRSMGFPLVVACGLLSSCGVWVFSLQLWHAGSRVHGFCSLRALLLRCASLVVVAHGLSCPVACGILVSQPGFKSVSPTLEGRFFTTGPSGKSQDCLFLWKMPLEF